MGLLTRACGDTHPFVVRKRSAHDPSLSRADKRRVVGVVHTQMLHSYWLQRGLGDSRHLFPGEVPLRIPASCSYALAESVLINVLKNCIAEESNAVFLFAAIRSSSAQAVANSCAWTTAALENSTRTSGKNQVFEVSSKRNVSQAMA